MTRFTSLQTTDYALPDAVLARTLTPVLVIHLDLVRENLRRMVAYAGGADRWRPHVKTTKLPEVWAEMARAGLRHFKCATTREARFLCETLRQERVEGADVCVAYPLRRPALDILRGIAQAHRDVRMSVQCEDSDLVGSIPDELGVFVDVNPGMNRTGIPSADTDTILAVARGAESRFRGVHYYDGHLHEGGPEERRREVFACYERLVELVQLLREEGLAVEEIVTSGTPTFLHALDYPPFREIDGTMHRISPGTVVFHDLRSEQENPNLELVPAAVIATRIVSHPAPDIATCDAGSKSIAAEAGDPCAFAIGRPGLVGLTPSEEHLPLRVADGARPARGEVVYLVPRHICPTVNLAEEALLVDGSDVRRVAVAARAHDVEG